jgi:hypothetical protein
MERGIQRARFNLEYFVRPAANSLRNCVAMARTPLQGLQDQHVECALKQLDPVLVWFFSLHDRTQTFYILGEVECLHLFVRISFRANKA